MIYQVIVEPDRNKMKFNDFVGKVSEKMRILQLEGIKILSVQYIIDKTSPFSTFTELDSLKTCAVILVDKQ